jgi:hypothetical protein
LSSRRVLGEDYLKSTVHICSKATAEMTSILVKAEDRLEGASNFNIWKVGVLNIFEENDLDSFVTSVVEEPNSNAGKENFKKNQAKEK